MTLQDLADQFCTGPFDSIDLHYEAFGGWRLTVDTAGRVYRAEGYTPEECVAEIVKTLVRRADERKLHAWNQWARGATVVAPAA